MKGAFYRKLIGLSRRWGPWAFELGARGIAAGYFGLFPSRVASSVRFYRAAFADRGSLFHIRTAWRQFQNFTTVYLDRFLLQETGDIRYSFSGWDLLEQAADQGAGGILLMSHQGNWEVAAALMMQRRPDLKILLYMGMDEKETIEKIHRKDGAGTGVRVLAVGKDGGSPFDIIEGIRFIREGGLVALTGDRLWRSDQRTVSASFFGHRVGLPEAPYLFALLAEAPLFVFFSHRSGPRRYHFRIAEVIDLPPASRRRRPAVIRAAAQRYADLLAEEVRRHPSQWYQFGPFLGPRLKRSDSL
ncbi:MAG: lysophospholipid acyltransferase family protein [Desulfobacterales bacterium]|nr:lysophospholipid acyltransferase family protein [Desulfobacterales bacterium]